jgi:hypothetical protein
MATPISVEERKAKQKIWAKAWLDKHPHYHRDYMRRTRASKRIRPLAGFIPMGRRYEMLAALLLGGRMSTDRNYDVFANGKTIEVKTRTYRKDKKGWSFRPNAFKADSYVFICLDEKEEIEKIYLFPGKKVGKSKWIGKKVVSDKYLITAP